MCTSKENESTVLSSRVIGFQMPRENVMGWCTAQCKAFSAPLGMLLVMKTLKDECYINIAIRFTIFEILRNFSLYYHILIAHPHYPYI